MAILQFSIVPLGTAGTSLSAYVAGVHKALEKSGVSHQLTPMGTILEGDLTRLLDLVREVHELPFLSGAERVMTLINIDDRRDRKATAQGKIDSVRRRLEEQGGSE